MYWMRFNKNIFYTRKTNNTPLRCRILNSTGLLSKSVKLAKYHIVAWYKRWQFYCTYYKIHCFWFFKTPSALTDAGGTDVKDPKVINMDAVSVDQSKVPTDSDLDALLRDKELMIDPYNEDEVLCFTVSGKANKIHHYSM